ncbi:MAG: amino acid adenylation domain-containing protein [Lachnospiraceae bacterium]|nr:amino acid adenylation domain-containing protein [Lachnospiraceae bacterium]
MQNHVLDYLNNIVLKKPDKVAFSNGVDHMTFSEVFDQSNAIGTYLLEKNIYRKPVVVFMNKHPKEVTAFFGVIRGGNFYVPIDEEMPGTRIQLILENVQPEIIICDEETKEIAKKFTFEGEIVVYDEIKNTPINKELLNKAYDSSIDTDPIYIVFTSGSTGVPKGVAACHRSVIDYIEQLSETLEFNEDTVFGNQTPLYFDACLKELYPTLKFGATTYLIPRSLFMFPVKLVEFLNEHRINTICWVVSALTMISAFGTFKTIKPKFLKVIAFGSEVFPIKQFNCWKEVLPEAKFTNLYGPTEGTGMCCYYKVNREFAVDEVIPIGRPFKNTEILLLTEDGKQAPSGEVGEICIRGTSVTLGYYNNWEKTNEVFVQNPLNKAYPELIYKTGDLGKYNEYGELIFVSRKDYQIKHMGHRIELGEIEVNVNLLEEIKISCCIYDEIKGRIVLYYVGNIDEKTLAQLLKDRLPRYMVPNNIIHIDKMPFTANGKIDRVTLKKKYQNG